MKQTEDIFPWKAHPNLPIKAFSESRKNIKFLFSDILKSTPKI